MAEDFSQFADATDGFERFSDAPIQKETVDLVSGDLTGSLKRDVIEGITEIGKGALAVAGGVGKQVAFDIPESLTSGFGAFPNSVSAWFQNKADEFDEKAEEIGLPKTAIKIGEEVGTGLLTGGLAGAIGKTVGGKVLAKTISTAKPGFKGGVKKTAARFLEEARKSPGKVALIEGVVSGAAEGTSKAAESAVLAGGGNDTAAGIAGFFAGIGGGTATGLKLYSKYMGALNLEKMNTGEKKLQEYLSQKYTPEQLSSFKADAESMSREGVEMTLEQITGDPRIARVRARLDKLDPSIGQKYDETVGGVSELFRKRAELMLDGAAGPEDVAIMIETIDRAITGKMSAFRSTLDDTFDVDVAESVNTALHEVFADAIENTKRHIDTLYDHVDMKQAMPEDLMIGIRDGIAKAIQTESKAKGVIPITVRASAKLLGREISTTRKTERLVKSRKNLKADLPSRTRKVVSSVKERPASLGGLKDIRSMISDRAMAAEASGRLSEAKRLRDMTGAITKAFEQMDSGHAFRKANDSYREFSELRSLNSILPFFSKRMSGESRKYPEKFQDIVFGPSAINDAKAAMKFAGGELGAVSGMTQDSVREGARNVFLSAIKASAGDGPVKASHVFKVVNKRKKVLEAYGLLDEFSGTLKTARRADALEISAKQVADLKLAEYGFSGGNTQLRRIIKDNTLQKEVRRVPHGDRASVMKAASRALMTDDFGKMLPHEKLVDNLKAYGSRVGIKPDHIARLERISAKIDGIPLGDDILALQDFLKTPRDLGATGLNLIFERLRRPISRIAIGLRFTGETIRSGEVRRELAAAIMTPEGSKRVMELAAKDPSSMGLVKWALRAKSAYAISGDE